MRPRCTPSGLIRTRVRSKSVPPEMLRSVVEKAVIQHDAARRRRIAKV